MLLNCCIQFAVKVWTVNLILLLLIMWWQLLQSTNMFITWLCTMKQQGWEASEADLGLFIGGLSSKSGDIARATYEKCYIIIVFLQDCIVLFTQ